MIEQDYYGTKRITAWPQEGKGALAGAPGYGTRYRDGYESWSPASEFEAAYQPITAMAFEHALRAAKDGNWVARAEWHEGAAISMTALRSGSRDGAFFIRRGALSTISWHPSEPDIFANDWRIVN